MARMRTLARAVKEIKEKDPNTCITSAGVLRRLVKEGNIPFIDRGHVIWVDMDDIEKFFAEKEW